MKRQDGDQMVKRPGGGTPGSNWNVLWCTNRLPGTGMVPGTGSMVEQ
jgi:hypothetical protein